MRGTAPRPRRPRPRGRRPRLAADGSVLGYPLPPERLDAWYAVHWTFHWRGEPFECTDRVDTTVSGNYLGDDREFARQHLKRRVTGYRGAFPLAEVTEPEEHREDLLAPRLDLARRLSEADHFRPGCHAVLGGTTHRAAPAVDPHGLVALAGGGAVPRSSSTPGTAPIGRSSGGAARSRPSARSRAGSRASTPAAVGASPTPTSWTRRPPPTARTPGTRWKPTRTASPTWPPTAPTCCPRADRTPPGGPAAVGRAAALRPRGGTPAGPSRSGREKQKTPAEAGVSHWCPRGDLNPHAR
ncbi:hypothetical protein ACFQ2M_09860 [Kitasatospora saccharophila]|uniref:hypothetical protein n=1 Tax=Kitasatospora saccharophila TaxID=407973 RepID=UPI0036448C04